MTPDREYRPSPIERLPVELIRGIMSALPDAVSLRATTLSCPLFYRAFLEAETAIAAQVLHNQIDVGVLPEALAASESSWLRPHDTDRTSREAIENFVAHHLCRRRAPPRSWPLQQALHLSRLHRFVDDFAGKFAGKFAASALAKPPLCRTEPVATPEERCRIERALYRFEIYCNLFRGSATSGSAVYGDQKRLFLANFAPWENEQLGCIHDFLVKAVAPAFNDVAEHDVAWGAFGVEYGDQMDSPWIQHLLSLGLEKLWHIAAAEDYEERYRLLCSGRSPRATESFLYEGLQSSNESSDRVWLDELTPEDEHAHIKAPFFADPDPGPADVWRWAHQEESWRNWVYQEDRQGLREWGYVMWDRSRLEEVGVFEKPWEQTASARDALLEEQEATRQRAYMANSLDKRERIYMAGGTGWWSWGDESKVVWPQAAAPAQRASAPAHIKPRSLEEARDMLSMMKLPASAK